MGEYARVIPPDDMPKEAVKKIMQGLLAGLGGLGALSTVAYSTAYLKDRADRLAWQKKIEEQLSRARGSKVKAHIPETVAASSPIVVMDEPEEKVGSLITKLAQARRALTLPRQ
jgi:hypothetical protein